MDCSKEALIEALQLVNNVTNIDGSNIEINQNMSKLEDLVTDLTNGESSFLPMFTIASALTSDIDSITKPSENNSYQQNQLGGVLGGNKSEMVHQVFMASLMKSMYENKNVLDTKAGRINHKNIEGIHNIKDMSAISNYDLMKLSMLGLPLNAFIDKLGNNAMNTLGIKSEDHGQNEFASIKLGLGRAMVQALINKGILETTSLSTEKYQKLLGTSDEMVKTFTDNKTKLTGQNMSESTTTFVKFSRAKSNKSKMSSKAQDMNKLLDHVANLKDNSGKRLFTSLFIDENSNIAHKAPQKVNTKVRGSVAELEEDSDDYKYIQSENSHAWKYNKFFDNMRTDLLKRSDGYKDENEIILEQFRIIQVAKNDGIDRAIDNMMEHREQLEDGEDFFMDHQKVRNSRSMQVGGFQPQNIKPHRAVTSKAGQEVKFERGDNSKQEQDFKAAIVQGMEDVLENPDELNWLDQKSIDKAFDEIMKNKEIMDLAEKVFGNGKNLNDNDLKLFDEVTGSEGTMSYKAFHEFYQYNKTKKDDEFTTDLTFEADAKNSALMHKALQYLDWDNKVHQDIMKGLGINLDGKDVDLTKPDAYIHLVDAFLENSNDNSRFRTTLENMYGDLTTPGSKKKLRKLFKYVVMPYIYGATTGSLKKKLLNDLESAIYKEIESILQEGKNKKGGRIERNEKINRITRGLGSYTVSNGNHSVELNRIQELTKDLDFMDSYFEETYGEIADSIKRESTAMQVNFIAVETHLNSRLNLAMEDYNKEIESEYRDEEASKRKIRSPERLPKHILEDIYSEILDQQGFNFKTGINNDGNPMYTVKKKSKNESKTSSQAKLKDENGSTKTFTLHQRTGSLEQLYTGGTVYFVHMLEDIMQGQLSSPTRLSIYDAEIIALGDVEKTVKKQNELSTSININRSQALETAENMVMSLMKNFDFGFESAHSLSNREIKKMLFRMYKMIEPDSKVTEASFVAKKYLKPEDLDADVITSYMTDLIEKAHAIENRRLEQMKGSKINNFQFKDNAYSMDKEQLDEIDKKLKYNETLKQDLKDSIEKIKNNINTMIEKADVVSQLKNMDRENKIRKKFNYRELKIAKKDTDYIGPNFDNEDVSNSNGLLGALKKKVKN